MKLQSIFQFNDPLLYLKHFYQYHKRHTPGFSYALFSQMAEIQSPNYLKQILEKKRKITPDKLCSISLALGLSHDEQEYFEVIVNLHQSSTNRERNYHKRRLAKFKGAKKAHRQKRTKKELIIDSWFIPIILLALDQTSQRSQHKKLCKIFGLSVEQLRDITNKFIEEDFLKLKNGIYQMTDQYIEFDAKKDPRNKLKNYLKESLALSNRALENNYNESKFYSHYFKIDKKNYSIYTSMFTELISQMTLQSDNDSGKDLFLMNLQFIEPLKTES